MQTHASEFLGVMDGLSPLEPAQDPLRVLVVDDNPGDARHIALLLKGGPYLCAIVNSYEDGLDLIHQRAHDAYLIDYRLGNRTGLDLIEEVSGAANGPLILVTGFHDPALDELALSAGASDYLPKDRLTPEDITRSIRYSVETWRARKAAETERERFRALSEGVPIGIGRLSPEGSFEDANQFLVDLLSYPDLASLIGSAFADHVETSGVRKSLLLESLSEPPDPFELQVKRHDGVLIWVGGVIQVVRGLEGKLSGYATALRDITARKEAEAQVLIQTEIIDQVRSGIIATDLESRVTYWNRHAEVLYGWKAQEALGRRLQDVIEPVHSTGRIDAILRVIEDVGHWSGDQQVRRKDGTTIPAHIDTTYLYDRDGVPVGIVSISTDITERMAADLALKESQHLFQEMFEGSPVGKTLFEVPSGRMVAVNHAAADFIGIPIEDLVGATRVANTNPDDLAADLALFERLVAGEIANYEIEKHYVFPDGSVKWALVKVSLVGELKNGAGLGLAHAIDITARKEAEEEVMFQASLLGQVHNAVIATDLDGIVTYWNRYAEQLYGWDSDEIMGRNYLEVTAPVLQRSLPRADVLAGLAADGKWEGEVVLFRKDGSSFPAWSSEALLRDQAGRPIGVVGIKVDLTTQKETQAEAQRQGDRARSLLEAQDEPHALISFDGQILAVNKAWVDLVGNAGIPQGDGGVGAHYVAVLGGSFASFDRAVAAGIDGVLAGATPRFQRDYSLTDGKPAKFLRLVVTSVPGTGALIAYWNVTDEVNARGALEDLIRSKDEFIASVSHELRTPLTAVVGLTHELSEGRVKPEEIPELQALIAQQAQEVSDIVEDLLVAARASADTITIQSSAFNIRKELLVVVKPWIRGGATTIDLSGVGPELMGRGDAGRVRQILRNLVANAVRYGGPPIAIGAWTVGGKVRIAVRDQGAGIPSEAVDRMFEPYARLGGHAGLPSSVGLGLYVSRLLARMMDGDLQYSRREGRTEFSLTLPAETRELGDLEVSEEAEVRLPLPTPTSPGIQALYLRQFPKTE